MKTFAVVSSVLALSGSAFALPAPAAADTQAQELPFSVIAAHSGSPIHLQPINASGQRFWINKQTATYCPLKPKSDCPPGKYTVFAGGHNTLAMDVEVPGGQLVYVTKEGELGFTQAHSATIPTGAKTTGFSKTEGSSFGDLGYKGGFVACPQNGGSVYKIYAQTPKFNQTNCIGFDALTSNYTMGAAAWQYT